MGDFQLPEGRPVSDRESLWEWFPCTRSQAADNAEALYPLYIVDESQVTTEKWSPNKLLFLLESLEDLDQSLRSVPRLPLSLNISVPHFLLPSKPFICIAPPA